MTEISATNDSISTQAGRDSVVHTDDRTVYNNCTVTIYVNHDRGALQALMFPVVLFLLLLIIYSACDHGPQVVTTPYQKADRPVHIEIQIYTLDV